MLRLFKLVLLTVTGLGCQLLLCIPSDPSNFIYFKYYMICAKPSLYVIPPSNPISFTCSSQRASDYLSPYLKNTDSLLRMYSYWSRLELNLGMSMVAARGVWESLLKIRYFLPPLLCL